MKNKAVTYALMCISLVAMTVKIMPLKITSLPGNISGIVNDNFTVSYPSSYKVIFDSEYITELDNSTFKMIKAGTTEVKLKSGIRTYTIPVTIKQDEIKSVLFYDIDGKELDNIKVKLGETLYNVVNNELLIPDNIANNSDIVLVTGEGNNIKQLLLGKVNKDKNIEIIADSTNSIVHDNRLYINLSTDMIRKSDSALDKGTEIDYTN